jgi:predicted nucleic acid-binding protein
VESEPPTAVPRSEPGRERAIEQGPAGAASELAAVASVVGNRGIGRLLADRHVGSKGLEAVARSPAAAGMLARSVLARQPPGAPPPAAPPRRVILIDANVLEQINRGNQGAATTLRTLIRNADVYISQQAFNESVQNPAIPRTATANRLMLDDLGIRVAPRGSLASRAYVYEHNVLPGGGTVASPADAATAAQARAINAEVWSFDRTYRLNYGSVQTRLGVQVAPESYSVPLANGVQDYRVGRQLLGLPAVEISLTGTVTRPVPPGGGGGPSGAGPGPAPRPPAGGGAPPAPSAAARAIATELNEEMKTTMRLARAATVLRTATAVLQAVGALLTLKTMVDMATSKLSGGGFFLTKELAQAEQIGDDARKLQNDYPAYSDSIQSSGFKLVAAPYGSLDSLKAVIWGLFFVMSDLVSIQESLKERVSALSKSLSEVTAKRKAAEAILNDPKASAALIMATFGTAELAQIFGAWDDLGHLEGRLTSALTSFQAVQPMVDADIAFLSAWISYLRVGVEQAEAATATSP